jgi:hypothetical protein
MAADEVALDPEATIACAHAHIQYGSEITAYGNRRADAIEAEVDGLGDWADGFKQQMKQGTLLAMRRAYSCRGECHKQFGRATLNQVHQLTGQDADSVGSISAIEP